MSTSKQGFVSSALKVKNIERADGGLYTCEAVNILKDVGEQRVNKSVRVIVGCKFMARIERNRYFTCVH